MKSTINKNIVLVGPGLLQIPISGKNGWGGIENTLTHIIKEFKIRNQEFTLVNDSINYNNIVRDITKNNDCIVHVHYDEYAEDLYKNKNYSLVSTSHSPYHPYTSMWLEHTKNHFNRLFTNIDAYFGQAHISNMHAKQINPNLFLGLCRCGISENEFINFRKNKGNKKSLVIGKIEGRKNQALLQQTFSNDLYIDFVGQNIDPNFKEMDVGKTKYLGSWSREQVYSKMTEYSTIILLSSFEGDVGVIKEAIASGCSVVVSKNASLNLDIDLPFIKVYDTIQDKNIFINDINIMNEENEKYRPFIFEYFKNKFDVSVTVDEYINSLNNLC